MNEQAMNNAPGPMMKGMLLFFAQGAYSGRIPGAPGTAGTVVGVLCYLAMQGLPFPGYAILTALTICAGAWIAGRAEEILGRTDHPSIVIDEIAGFLVAMMLVPGDWTFIIAGFVLFRLFDIIKPFPLQRLQRLHGGLGVMLDDIGAGIYTNLVLQVLAQMLAR